MEFTASTMVWIVPAYQRRLALMLKARLCYKDGGLAVILGANGGGVIHMPVYTQ